MALGRKPIEIVESGTHQLLVKSDSWERVWLHQVAEVKNGFAFQSKFFNHDSGLPLIRIRDISKTATENLYSGKFEEEYLVLKGEILIGMDGDFNCARWQGKQALLNQRVCKIIPTTELYSDKFLYLCLQPYLNAINQETSSITVKHLSSKTVEEIPLPLPPLNEQHRIVAKIEELFSELDKGVESLKQAREQLKAYRQALLKHAFEGKLTEQWRKENADKLETAEQLLERIKHERKARYQQQLEDWKNGKIPSKPKALTELKHISSIDTPENWIEFSMNHICSIEDGDRGKEYPNKDDFTESGYCLFLNTKNVTKKGFNFDNLSFISKEKHEKLRKGTLIRNDIVFTSRGTIGNTSYYGKNVQFYPVRINSGMFLLRNYEAFFNEDFFIYLLQSPKVTNQIEKLKSGSAQPQLPIRDFKTLRIPVPQKLEQFNIVKILDEKISILEDTISDIDNNLQKSESLRQSILKKAFSGQLVPQDPNDEPASILLERIAREKADAAATAKKGRGVKKSQKI